METNKLTDDETKIVESGKCPYCKLALVDTSNEEVRAKTCHRCNRLYVLEKLEPFPLVQEMQDAVMDFLTKSTVDGNLCFVRDPKTDDVIALINKESIKNKEQMMLLFKLVSSQLTTLIGEEKCKNLIKLPGQQ